MKNQQKSDFNTKSLNSIPFGGPIGKHIFWMSLQLDAAIARKTSKQLAITFTSGTCKGTTIICML